MFRNVHTVLVKPLVCGHAVVLCEDASGKPGEKQTTSDPPVASHHGCYQQDGSSAQGWEKQCPVKENWCEKKWGKSQHVNTERPVLEGVSARHQCRYHEVKLWSKYLLCDSVGLWWNGSLMYRLSSLVSCWCLKKKKHKHALNNIRSWKIETYLCRHTDI